MTRTEMIQTATTMHQSQSGYHFDPAVIAATIDGGLVAGEIVAMGGAARAVVVSPVEVTLQRRSGEQWIEVALPEDKRALAVDKALVCKAYNQSAQGSAMIAGAR